MPSQYFTDREFGEKPRATEQIDQRVWGAVISLIETKIDDGSFGYRFPLVCDDSGHQPFGCDRSAFALMLQAEVPRVEWPLRQDALPDAPDILDLLEFCCSAVGQPIQKSWHQFFNHHHLTWDRDSGLASFVADINRLFARNGIAFELSSAGSVSRCLPASLQQMVTGGVSKACWFALCSCAPVRYAEVSEARGDPPCPASIRPNSAACLPA